MLEIGGMRIFFGDFHGQWNEDHDNPSLLLAGYSFYGYDFCVFQGPGNSDAITSMMENLGMPFKVFAGRELMYNFNHITTLGFDGDIPPIDDPDVRNVLNKLHGCAKLIIAAHPWPSIISKLQDLIAEGLIDAIELVNTANWNEPLMKWYYERLSKGDKIPIVSGLDIHRSHEFQRPDILYTANYPANNDIHQLGAHRTLVFCENCTEKEIIRAVRECRTLIEFNGQLLGPADLIRKLEDAGYREKAADQQKEREAFDLELLHGSHLVAGTRTRFKVYGQSSGKAVLLTPGGTSREITWSRNNHALDIDNLPHLFDRNQFFMPLNVIADQGLSRTFALKTKSPVEISLLSETESGNNPERLVIADIRNNTGKELYPGYTLSSAALEKTIEGKIQIEPYYTGRISTPVEPLEEVSRPVKFTLAVESGDFRRMFSRNLVFVSCNYAENITEKEWDKAGKIFIGYDDQIDPMFTSSWNGPDDISGKFSLLWNEQGLYVRGWIVDDILYTRSSDTDITVFGDCIQIGINPVNRDDVPGMSFYNITLTRGAEEEPQMRIETVPKFAVYGMAPAGYRIPASFYDMKKLDKTTTRCTLFLPWSLLIPMQPVAGYRFGLYLLLWDNDGSGVKTSLQWPRYMEKETGNAWWSPQNGAWAQMRLDRF